MLLQETYLRLHFQEKDNLISLSTSTLDICHYSFTIYIPIHSPVCSLRLCSILPSQQIKSFWIDISLCSSPFVCFVTLNVPVRKNFEVVFLHFAVRGQDFLSLPPQPLRHPFLNASPGAFPPVVAGLLVVVIAFVLFSYDDFHVVYIAPIFLYAIFEGRWW